MTAPAENFWILLNRNHFNKLIHSDTNINKPLLLRDIKGGNDPNLLSCNKFSCLDGKIFASLFYYSDQFSPQFLTKLEDRVSEVVEELDTGDMVLILSQVARKKRRNVPLLKTLSFYICKNKNLLDIKQLADTLFALNQLSFRVCVT